MSHLESGQKTVRELTSMHPLWEEYTFASEPTLDSSGAFDLSNEDEEEKFYLNPYSGELSLDMPKVDGRCRGGILA